MTDFKYAEYERRLANLKNKTELFLTQTGHSDLVEKLKSDLSDVSERKELRIAFVGQYSSGKSTIISAMTGNKEIKIDANVSTDIVSEYRWNNIVLLDTPGILAGKIEEHDQRTKEALKDSDLIFYVLTSQLFDAVIFNNFIDLAYNQHLEDKIFIIVNKMGMEYGEYDDLIESYKSSLKLIFEERGYDITRFPIAFIDAADYIDGVEDGDEEFKEMSHFEKFINLLNSFVSNKGLIKKQFDSPVRIMQNAVQSVAISQVDPAMYEFYRQFETRLNRSQREMKRDLSGLIYNFNSSCMAEVVNTANNIGEVDEAQWNVLSNDLEKNLNNKISQLAVDIDNVVNSNYAQLLEEMQEFGGKDAIVKYSESLDAKLQQPGISIEEKTNFETQKRILGWLRTGAAKVADAVPGIDSVFQGVSGASGSQLHSIVKQVGHFFGKKFKPWEAVRMASRIGKVAKFGVPLLGAALDVYFADKERRDENKRLQQIKESRNRFITEYQTTINGIIDSYTQEIQIIYSNYDTKRDDLLKSKNELAQTIKNNESIAMGIENLNEEYVDFIEIIDGESEE